MIFQRLLEQRARVTPAEKRAFARQIDRLIRRTGKIEADKVEGMIDLLQKARAGVDDALRDLPRKAEFSRAMSREIKAEINRLMNRFAGQAVNRLGLDEQDFAKMGLEFTDEIAAAQGVRLGRLEIAPELVENAATRSADLIRSLSDAQIARANDILNVGIIRGQSVFEVASDMADAFDKGLAQMETIARTEMLGIHSQVQFAQMRDISEFSPGLRKQWYSVLDERTRPAHEEAHLQVQEWDEPFRVDDEDLMFPRDPAGSPGNVANCRCSMFPLFPEEKPLEESTQGPQEPTLTRQDAPPVRLPLEGQAARVFKRLRRRGVRPPRSLVAT